MKSQVDATLAHLKDFQRLTVEYVFERLWGTDPVPRFLVADEVGLGKTLVARGVVAKTIEHLRRRNEERIDVVYICSNRQIAQQNLRRLHDGIGVQIPHADRLTLLPRVLQQMQTRSTDGPAINIISFTPGTSFQLGGSGGTKSERALIHVLLEELWGRRAVSSPKWEKFFQGAAKLESMRWERRCIDRSSLTGEVLTSFQSRLQVEPFEENMSLVDALRDTVEHFAYLRQGKNVSWEVSHRRYRIIGRLRHVLAEACIGHLDPDLVILDEFQRFNSLLHGEDDAAVLAQRLLGDEVINPDLRHTQTRVLLLSATPFKMYTLPDEPEGDDHYRDFTQTVRFLAGGERAERVRLALKDMRTALLTDDIEGARAAKERAQSNDQNLWMALGGVT